MENPSAPREPSVPLWQVNAIRILFLLMAFVMGSFVWTQVLFESADWPVMRGLAKSMLAALALLSLWGVRYPLRMLPLMIYELAWKTIWIGLIAYPAWASDRWTKDIEGLFYDCIGIVIAFFIIPWPYVWFHYIKAPMEAWRKPS